MNEKTMNQIAEMKKQTIGVEVEMNSITRQKPQSSQPSFSAQAEVRIPQAATDTAPGRLGTQTAGNGNSKRMSA